MKNAFTQCSIAAWYSGSIVVWCFNRTVTERRHFMLHYWLHIWLLYVGRCSWWELICFWSKLFDKPVLLLGSIEVNRFLNIWITFYYEMTLKLLLGYKYWHRSTKCYGFKQWPVYQLWLLIGYKSICVCDICYSTCIFIQLYKTCANIYLSAWISEWGGGCINSKTAKCPN